MKTVKFKVMLWFIITLIIMFVLTGWMIYRLQIRSSYKAFDSYLNASARKVINYLKLENFKDISLRSFLNNIGTTDISYYIFDEGKKQVFSFTSEMDTDSPTARLALQRFFSGHSTPFTIKVSRVLSPENVQQSIQRIAIFPFRKNKETYYLVAMRSMEEFNTTLSKTTIWLWIGLAIIFTVVITGGYIIISKALKPIEMMAFQMKGLKPENLSFRVKVPKFGSEIETLETSINTALDRVEEGVRKIERFSSMAAHELRTPITIIKSRAQLALIKNSKDEMYKSLEKIVQKTDEMTRLVEMLLGLTRIREDVIRDFRQVDLSEIVVESIEELVKDYPNRIEIDSQPGVIVNGSSLLLKEMIKNIVENACKYTSGRVKVTLKENYLEVSDEGPGMDRETLENAFKEFFRGRTDVPGFGLGLNLAKSIASLHSMTVDIDSSPKTGTRVRIGFQLLTRNPV